MRTTGQRLRNEVQHPDRYEETTIESGGVPIVLSVWRGTPQAPVVVFFSGTMGHPLFHEEFLDGLNQAGFSVVGLHPQGHGKSPRVRQTLRWADMVRNAVDTIDWTVRSFEGPVVVVGSSQGGILATTVASKCPGLAAVFARNHGGPSPSPDPRDHELSPVASTYLPPSTCHHRPAGSPGSQAPSPDWLLPRSGSRLSRSVDQGAVPPRSTASP